VSAAVDERADDLPDWYIPDDLLAEATPSELAAYRSFLERELLEENARDVAALEADWRPWLRALFATYTASGFAPHHEEFWRWCWGIEAGVAPEAFVAVWPRGGAKSTSAELAIVALAARRRRRYGLYVCETQDQADDHVKSVSDMLELPSVARLYPSLAERAVSKFGHVKGWRRNRLWTADGFVLDAMGLDTAARGVKLDDRRPDLMVLDDLDGEHDGPDAVDKKITSLTHKLLPAGATGLAVLAIQNLVHANSIFARLVGVADEGAEFLARRRQSGPVPAVEGLVIEQHEGRAVITSGSPTWAGMGIEVCQEKVDQFGVSAFLAECQHEVSAPPGGMFDHLEFAHCTWDDLPDLERAVVWVDPAVTDTARSDSMGIQADALGSDGVLYRLWSWERRSSPLEALKLAIRVAQRIGADHVGVETDQGGDTWQSVYREATADVAAEDAAEGLPPLPAPRFTWDKAGSGHGPKAHRASKMLADYERPRSIVHVAGSTPLGAATVDVLERALRRFPRTKPLDLVDACFWSWRDLRPERAAKRGGLRFRSAA
jgi:hypothetical protein